LRIVYAHEVAAVRLVTSGAPTPYWETILSQESWATIVLGSERQLDTLAVYYVPNQIDARIVRGYRCAGRDSLFNEWAAALQFPYYFGRNWAAFDDCMADLSWLRSSKVVVFVACSDALLTSESATFERFAEGLRDAVTDPVGTSKHDQAMPTRELRLVFHSEHGDGVRARLGSLGEGVVALDLGPESTD
jgi:hypothetical protein